MKSFNKPQKYPSYSPIPLKNRQWPNRVVTQAPQWCSVDLRDGNQALIDPMTLEQKVVMFQMLVDVGFKQIEVGFPSAAEVEYEFLRTLVEEKRIPSDVRVQVLTQARPHLIEKTFEALEGVSKATLHLYTPTSTLQREVVFQTDPEGIKSIAVEGTQMVKNYVTQMPDSDIVFEFSPESFTGTELEVALDVCEGVINAWQPTPDKPMIINLPATVEMSTPNIYADQIEWFSQNVKDRDSIILSIHTHNDRGTGVAASELALLAGADRVEGTLFGNGERTGNVDIVTMALNLFSQGVDPHLDFSDINQVIQTYETCTGMEVHPRHPYAGKLVYTAFSGSHQDAIRKGMLNFQKDSTGPWAVPYLPIDPEDVGRTYESIIRINSQSGKGGVAYIMENEFGYKLPKAMHAEFGKSIQKLSDERGIEITPQEILELFHKEYLPSSGAIQISNWNTELLEERDSSNHPFTHVKFECTVDEHSFDVEGKGNGPINAFVQALNHRLPFPIQVLSYDEHALGTGSDARAVSYIQIEYQGQKIFGVGVDTHIIWASIQAIVSAMNRLPQIKMDFSFTSPSRSPLKETVVQ